MKKHKKKNCYRNLYNLEARVQITAIIREMSNEPERQCEKIAEEVVNFLNHEGIV